MKLKTIGVCVILLSMLLALGRGWAEPVLSEEDLFLSASRKYREEEDKTQALRQYWLFLQSYARSSYAPQAQYMVAECLFQKGDYQGAIREYKRARGYPSQDEFTSTSILLRMGEAYFNLKDYDHALNCFNRLIKDHSKSFLVPEALYGKVECQILLGKWEKAEKSLQKLVQLRPAYEKTAKISFLKGLLLYHQERYEEALKSFELVPEDRGIYYCGRCLENLGEFLPAVQKYKTVLDQFPRSNLADNASYSIGESFWKAGQFSLATESLERMIAQYPHSPYAPYAYYLLACVLYQSERYEEAIDLLYPLPQRYPQSPAIPFVQYLIGNSFLALDRLDDAIFNYTKVAKSSPDEEVAAAAQHKICWCRGKKGEFVKLIISAEEFLRRFGGDRLAGRVNLLRGTSYLKLRRFKEAIKTFGSILDKYPGTGLAEKALYLSIMSYYLQGKYERLVTNYSYLTDNLSPSSSPWRALTYFYLGEAYYHLGLWKKAERMYRLVVETYPQNPLAPYAVQGVTACFSQRGEYGLALEEQRRLLSQIADQDALKGSDQLTIAGIYFNQREYEKALRLLEDFVSRNPQSPQVPSALFQLGSCYYRLRYYQQAIESWTRLVDRYPENPQVPEAIFKIAETQFGLEDYGSALLTYGESIKRGGERAKEALFQTANCYYNMKQTQEAIDAYQKYIDQYPDDPKAADALEGIQLCYYRTGKSLTDLIKKYPGSKLAADAYWQKGKEAFAQGDYSTAKTFFQKVVLNFPLSKSAPPSLFYMGECHYKLKEYERAVVCYRNFVSTYPQDNLSPQAKFKLGNVLFKLNKYRESIKVYREIAETIDDTVFAPASQYNIALCYKKLAGWGDLIRAYERFVQKYPWSPKRDFVLMDLGLVYQTKLEDYEKAISVYQKVQPGGEVSYSELHFRLAECYDGLEKGEEAVQEYKRVASTKPAADSYRLAALARLGQKYEDQARWKEAIGVYQDILSSGGKREWVEAAKERIEQIKRLDRL